MKRGDVWVVVVLLIVILIVIIPTWLKNETAVSGQQKMAAIKVNGELYETVMLGDERQTIRVDTRHGVNVLEVNDGEIRMIEADCPDELCIWSGAISMVNETIVCLPHRLIVEIIDPTYEGDGIDAVVQ